jgi:hypothetical protein
MFSGALSIINFFSRGNNNNEELEEKQAYENSLLCRFVLDGLGKKIGESVAVDEDILIIKSGKKYLGVPLKHVEEEGKAILVKGLIDKENAESMGEKWRQESFKEIDHNVADE